MELSDADLCKRSKELELQELQKYAFSPACISALEALLLDVHAALSPTKIDYEHRRNLVQVFDMMAKNAYRHSGDSPTMVPFGSFVMDMFTAKSDLDLSLNFSADETASFPREKKISVLRMFAKILYGLQRKGKMSGVLPILRARVPVLKVVHCDTGVECDISVENEDGISRSLIINLMCLVDERFRILSFLMKAWAKAHDINSAKDHTLSSLSIILLVAFHLQTRDPPILPPFSVLLRDGPHPVNVENVVHGFKHFGAENKESVAELFIALLGKLSSVRSLWELGLCASTYGGFWISKTWETDNIGVEDFLDRSQNCARAVGKEELPKIYSLIETSISHLVQFMNGQVEGSDLKILLFGPASLHTQDETIVLNGSETPKKRKKKRKVPSHDLVAAPVVTKKIHKTGRPEQLCHQIPGVPSHDSLGALDNAKKIRVTGKPDQLHSQIPSVPSHGSVAAPVNAKKIRNSRKPDQLHKQIPSIPSHDSVAAPDNTKKIHHTGKSEQLHSQIPRATTVHPKQFVPLYHQPIPGQLTCQGQDRLKFLPQHFHLPYHRPQQPLFQGQDRLQFLPQHFHLPYHRPQQQLLAPALACGPRLPGPPFNAWQLGCGSHDPSPLLAPNLVYGPEHYPSNPSVPLGLQSGHQTQHPLIARELHYRPSHDAQPSLSQSSHLDFSSHSIHPTSLVDGHHTIQIRYHGHSQHPGQLVRPFYQG